MKRIISVLFLLIAVATGAAAAETGDMAVCVKYNYASKYNQSGIGFEYQLDLFSKVRLASDFDCYVFDDDHLVWDMSYNVQYVITPFSRFTVYPFGGLTIAHWNEYPAEHKKGEDKIGPNLGCGADYSISSTVSFFTEERFQLISDHHQSVTSFGLRYMFDF
jgi:hypothetical protein